MTFVAQNSRPGKIDPYVMFNRNRRPDGWKLITVAFRIYKKTVCIYGLEEKMQMKTKYREESNLHVIEKVEMSQIFDDDQTMIKKIFK